MPPRLRNRHPDLVSPGRDSRDRHRQDPCRSRHCRRDRCGHRRCCLRDEELQEQIASLSCAHDQGASMTILWFVVWLLVNTFSSHQPLLFDPVNASTATLILAIGLDLAAAHAPRSANQARIRRPCCVTCDARSTAPQKAHERLRPLAVGFGPGAPAPGVAEGSAAASPRADRRALARAVGARACRDAPLQVGESTAMSSGSPASGGAACAPNAVLSLEAGDRLGGYRDPSAQRLKYNAVALRQP